MKTEMNVKLIEEAINIVNGLHICDVGSRKERLQHLLKRAIAQEPRFYKGQQGWVSNDETHWQRAVLSNITKAGFVCDRIDGGKSPWHHFKPDPDAVTLPVESSDIHRATDSHNTERRVASVDGTMYCIISPYEVLS